MRGFRGYLFTFAGTFALVAALALASHSRVESQGQRPDTPVKVTNTAADPVPVVGSVDIGGVTGTIQVEQSGLWNVEVTDLPAVQQGGAWSVDVDSLPAVQQGGAWSVDVDSLPAVQQGGNWSVGIDGTPTVNLGAGNSVGIDGTPTVNLGAGNSVGIDGTPTVNLGAGASVNIGNTAASPVPVEVVSNGGSATPITISDSRTWEDGQFIHEMDYTVPAGKVLVIRHVSATANLQPGQRARFELLVLGTHQSRRHFESGLTQMAVRDYLSANHHTEIYATGFLRFRVDRSATNGPSVVDITLSGVLVDL